MLLDVEFDEPGRFNRFVQRVNRAPMVWNIAVLFRCLYFLFSLGFMALVNDLSIESPLATFS